MGEVASFFQVWNSFSLPEGKFLSLGFLNGLRERKRLVDKPGSRVPKSFSSYKTIMHALRNS